jgi:hypothetical protein
MCCVKAANDVLIPEVYERQKHPFTTEVINGRLEARRRNALGFRNPTHYRWRSLLHSGALHSLVNAL